MRRAALALIVDRPRRRLRGRRGARGHEAHPRRLLDAARGVRRDHPGFPARRSRARTSRSASPTAPRESSPAPSRPGLEGRHRRPLAGAGRRLAREGGARRREVGPAVVPRHGAPLRRRLRRPRRQPEEDQGLERPAPVRRRGDHAEPVHLRRRALEHHGRVRRLAAHRQDRQAGAGQPAEAVPERLGAGQERARIAADVRLRARATSCSPTRTRPSSPARTARTSSSRSRGRRS